MYRLTGDKLWQDKGWRMFSAWMDNALVDDGFASVSDVRRKAGTKIDNMERCARLPGLLVTRSAQPLTDADTGVARQLCPGRDVQVPLPAARRPVAAQPRRLRAQHRCVPRLPSSHLCTTSSLTTPPLPVRAEAHPLLVNPVIQPGSQGLWS